MGTGIDTSTMVLMAKLFRNVCSQAVRLLENFRFSADQARSRTIASGVSPQHGFDTKAWFEELDRFNAEEPFMPEGREQPEPPEREFFN